MTTIVATNKSQQSQAVVDPWTVVHFSSGLAAGLAGFPFWTSMIAATLYEVIEHEGQKGETWQRLFNTSGPEIVENAIFDVVIFGVGWYAGQKWNET